jgi:hypothetical protein
MKASVLFGTGWENDSLEVLWRDAGRVFCRQWRDEATPRDVVGKILYLRQHYHFGPGKMPTT